jgi:hypothetical protein
MDNSDSSSNSSNESYVTALEELESDFIELEKFVEHTSKDGTVWILPCEYEDEHKYVNHCGTKRLGSSTQNDSCILRKQ